MKQSYDSSAKTHLPRRMLAMLLAVLMLAALLPTSVFAANPGGDCGNCTWSIVDGTLTISPKADTDGVLADPVNNKWPWSDNAADVTAVVIESGVKAGTRTKFMFENFSKLQSLDLSNLDTSNVENMQDMFNGCLELNSITFGESFSTAKVTNMMSVFANCPKLTSLDISGWDTTNVTNMEWFFSGCKKLETVYVGDNWKVASTNNNMYKDCNATLSRVYGYRYPVYKTTEGTAYAQASSGIQEWKTDTCREYTLINAYNKPTTWGTAGQITWYVVDGAVEYINSPITIAGDVRLILADGCSFKADASGAASKAAIKVSGEGNALTVYAQSDDPATMGTLTATGGNVSGSYNFACGAGIGGDSIHAGENITINGGFVNAAGGHSDDGSICGAGIGGGYYGSGKNITVNGGIVKAISSVGAGIGGGCSGPGENITVNGGIVTATSSKGAGIGGGYYANGEDITITGGTVTAISTTGAGIGGGYYANGEDITITGGSVTATSSKGAGIGGGEGCNGQNISITGGSVTATSTSGDSIGNGETGSCSKSITAATVFAVKAGADDATAADIGNDGTDLAAKLSGKKYATIVSAVATVAHTENEKTVTASYSSLKAAIEGAKAGDTVTLLQNVSCTSPITIGKSITIDLNGKTFTIDTAVRQDKKIYTSGTNDASEGKTVTVTIKNGTIDGDLYSNGNTNADTYDMLILEDCTCEGHVYSSGKATIKKCTINGTIYTQHTGTATVEDTTANKLETQYAISGSTLTFKSGKLNNSIIATADCPVTLSGGIFKNNPVGVTGVVIPNYYGCVTNPDSATNSSYPYMVKYLHDHGNFTYTAEGGVLTATCNGTGTAPCTLTDKKVCLTLTAPDAAYTGSAYTGAALDSTAWAAIGLQVPQIVYTSKDGVAYPANTVAPTAEGEYTASVTVGAATASVDFTISARLELLVTGNETAEYTWTGKALAGAKLTVTGKMNGVEKTPSKGYTYTWYAADDTANSKALAGAPSAVGAYKLVVSVAADDPVYSGTSAPYYFKIMPVEITESHLPVQISKRSYDKSLRPTITFVSPCEYSDFVKVTLNGNELPSQFYTVEQGSTKVSINGGYIHSLSEGDYEFAIVSRMPGTEEEVATVVLAVNLYAPAATAQQPTATAATAQNQKTVTTAKAAKETAEPEDEPAEEVTAEPVEEPAEEVTEEPVEEPAEETATEEPAEEIVEETTEEAVEEPAEEADGAGKSHTALWVAIPVAVAAAAGIWFVVAKKRKEDDEEEASAK